jgi:hypothetical protein
MKKNPTTYAVTTNRIRGLLEKDNRFIASASIICFAFGLVLSHLIEPSVRVQKATFAEETKPTTDSGLRELLYFLDTVEPLAVIRRNNVND